MKRIVIVANGEQMARDALKALRRAAEKAFELARQTGTPCYVLEDGRIYEVLRRDLILVTTHHLTIGTDISPRHGLPMETTYVSPDLVLRAEDLQPAT